MTSARRTTLGSIALVFIVCSAIGAAAMHFDVLTVLKPQSRLLKFRRTCATCPNYTITITGDGLLTYEGGDYALVQRTRQFYLDAATVNALFDDFTQPEFMEMENTYPAPGPDRMTVSLSVQIGDFTKSVFSEQDYGPALRQTLERKLDDLPGMRALSGWTF